MTAHYPDFPSSSGIPNLDFLVVPRTDQPASIRAEGDREQPAVAFKSFDRKNLAPGDGIPNLNPSSAGKQRFVAGGRQEPAGRVIGEAEYDNGMARQLARSPEFGTVP